MVTSLTTPFRPSDIPTGLVGYWKFNNDATDSSASGYNLTAVNSPAYAQEDYWKSGEYSSDLVSATPTYFTHTDDSALDFAGTSFSGAGWVKIDTLATTTRYFMMKGDWAPTNGWYFYATGNSATTMAFMLNGTSYTGPSGDMVVGKWQHVAFVRNIVAGTVELYVNGNLTYSVASAVTLAGNASDFMVGKHPSGGAFDGKQKDFALWNRALTPLEIKSLAMGVDLSKYAYRPDNVSTAPTAWWKMNEVSGNAIDAMGTYNLTETSGTIVPTGGYVEGVGRLFATVATEYFSYANDAIFQADGHISWFAWVKKTTNGDNTYVVGKGTGGTTAKGWGARFATTGSPFEVRIAGGTATATTKAFTEAGTWMHIGFTFDATSNILIIYVDGKADTTVNPYNANIASYGSNTTDFQLGSADNTSYYGGAMQDACFWKGYVVTPAEVASLAAGMPIQQAGIVSYWKMDEASGNAVDSIGSHTLTDSGAVGTAAGKVGTARDFEKDTPDKFTVLNASKGDLELSTTHGSGWAFITWAKPESSAASAYIVDGDVVKQYAISMNAGNAVLSWNSNASDTSTALIADGVWGHICGTWDGAKNFIYVNASNSSGGTANTTMPTDSSANFVIGSRADGSTTPFDGLLDETIFSARYFRPEEIKAVYLKGLNGKEVTSSEVSPSSTDTSAFLMFF